MWEDLEEEVAELFAPLEGHVSRADGFFIFHPFKPPRSKVVGVCLKCGGEFEGPRNKKYCNEECFFQHYRTAVRPLATKFEISCKQCGTGFIGLPSRKFCCPRCSKIFVKAARGIVCPFPGPG